MNASMPFDFDAAVVAPFRMQPGLRRMRQPSALTALAPGHPAFADKLAVLCAAPQQALLSVSGFDPVPALQALVNEAALHCPAAVAVDPLGVQAPALGLHLAWLGAAVTAGPQAHAAAKACLDRLAAPQRLPALLCLALHEDIAIVDGQRASLPWMAVCQPSHWVPADKVGRSFAEVHGPVPDAEMLRAASAHLARLVCQPQRWERFVWTITPDARHDQHPARHPRVDWPDEADALIAAAHWRTEHQRFLPLPGQQQALFTIHVDVQPLARAIDTPRRAATLHAALASMSDAVLAYRGLTAARTPLLAWLRDRAGAPPAA